MGCLTVLRAIVVRFLFACHGMIAIWRLFIVLKDKRVWYLASSLGALLLETLFTLGKKGGKEWKWFCPSVFIYLVSVVPSIWFLEMHEMDRRIVFRNSANRSSETLNDTREELKASLGSVLGVRFEIRIPLQLNSDQWIRTLEQLLLLLLILGRWILPKGKLTHDQLSQLLLVYIGTAADIVEFFEAFKEEKVRYNSLLCTIILGIWSLSLLQFTLVLTAARTRLDQSGLVSATPVKNVGCCQADVYGILISILLQDAPFLVLRMLLIFKYNVLSYTNMFFTSKNSLVIILLIYRLIVVQVERYRARNDDVSDDANPNLYAVRLYRSPDSMSMAESTTGSRARLVKSVSHTSNGFPDAVRNDVDRNRDTGRNHEGGRNHDAGRKHEAGRIDPNKASEKARTLRRATIDELTSNA